MAFAPFLHVCVRRFVLQTLVDKMPLFAGASEKLISKIMQKLEEHIYLQVTPLAHAGAGERATLISDALPKNLIAG